MLPHSTPARRIRIGANLFICMLFSSDFRYYYKGSVHFVNAQTKRGDEKGRRKRETKKGDEKGRRKRDGPFAHPFLPQRKGSLERETFVPPAGDRLLGEGAVGPWAD
jgi:hypothetical protein